MESAYGRLHDAIIRRQRLVLAALGLLVVAASFATTKLQLDVSFRPFFADADSQAAVTKQYEKRFGQPSGAYLVAIISHRDILGPTFLGQLDGLGKRVGAIPHIEQVTSIADLTGGT